MQQMMSRDNITTKKKILSFKKENNGSKEESLAHKNYEIPPSEDCQVPLFEKRE